MNKSPSRRLSPLSTARLHVVRALAWLLSRFGRAYVWLMYSKDLTAPLAAYVAKIELEIDNAGADEMLDVASLYHHRHPEKAAARARMYHQRLRGGSSCFVGRVEGRIVAYIWIRVATAVGAHDLRMYLRTDEIYVTDAYTAQAWRGRGIHPALNNAMLRIAQAKGYRIAYTLVRADNDRSWVTLPRVGWQHTGTLLYFRPSWAAHKTFWHVHGNPYPMPVGRAAAGLQKSAAAAPESGAAGAADLTQAGRFDFDRFDQRELISDWPWAKTYQLRNKQQVAYLKIVPREYAAVLQASAILAKAQPAHVPQVMACDHSENGWLLTHAHGGTQLEGQSPPEDLLALINTYARVQAASVSNQELIDCLPAAPVAQALPSLIDFLHPDWSSPNASGQVGAAYFLGHARTVAFRNALGQARSLLVQHLASAKHLPCTVNHGALYRSHAAKTASGDIVLFNWTSASFGPAGLSLHGLFGGCLLPCKLLLRKQHQQQDGLVDAGSLPAQLIAAYMNTLASAGYANQQLLSNCLPASITSGAMIWLAHFANFAAEEASQRESIRDQLLGGLNDLLQLCEYLSVRSTSA